MEISTKFTVDSIREELGAVAFDVAAHLDRRQR